MRIVNLVLFLILIGAGIYKWMPENTEFSGTRWSCNELSTGFTSAPYEKYQEILERDLFDFASSSNLTLYQSGELVFKNGEREKYELLYELGYKTVAKNKISLVYKKIDWHRQPKNAPIFIRDIESLKEFEFDLKYIIDDGQLYFQNRIKNEDKNFVCFAS